VRYLPVGVQVTALAGSADGNVVVAGTADGDLLRWDVDSGTRSAVRAGRGKITAIAVNADGTRIVGADGGGTYLWNMTAKTYSRLIYSGQTRSVAVSPSGRTIAVLSGSLFTPGRLILMDGMSGHELRQTSAALTGYYVGLSSDNSVVVDNGNGTWSRLPVTTLAPVTSGGLLDIPGDLLYCCGFSQDGNYFAWAKYGGINVVNEKPNASSGQSDTSQVATAAIPLQEPDQFAVSEDGTKVAVAGGNALYVTSVSTTGNPLPPQQLSGTGGITALAFFGSTQRLASASGTSVVLWNLSQVSRIAVSPTINAPDGSNVGVPPQIASSPNGKHIAISGENFQPIIIQDLGISPPTETVINAPPFSGRNAYSTLPLWSADGRRLFLLGDGGSGDSAVQWSDGHFGKEWPTTSTRWGAATGQVLAARFSPNGQRLVFIDAYGDIQVRSAANGTILHAIPGVKKTISQAPPQNLAAISDDTAFAAIVLPSGTVRVTQIDSGRSHDLPGILASTVTFSQDRLLIECQDNSLEIWDTAATHLYRSIPSDAIYAHGMTAIPRTQLIARVTGQGIVVLTDLESGQVLGSLTLPYPARAAGEPPWDATTVSASPDGTKLITATTSGSAIRWELRPEAWVKAACAAAGHSLTLDEWRQIVGTTPPTDLACHST
jgi:WD40 repeat protein